MEGMSFVDFSEAAAAEEAGELVFSENGGRAGGWWLL